MTIGIARIRAAYGILAIVGLAAVPGLMSPACSANAEVAITPSQTTVSATSDAPSTSGTPTSTLAPSPSSTSTAMPSTAIAERVQIAATSSQSPTPTPEPTATRISLTPKDIEETWRMWGVRIGEARVAGGEGILATIYGWPVTIGEFEERKERLLISIERFRHELDQAVIAEDTSTLDEPRRVAVNSLLSAIEKYDIDAMALSSLLMEFSRYHLAVRLGKANPSDTEIVAEIQEHRTAFGEQYNRWPSDGPLWALIEGYVQAVGQERYWSEYLPMGLKRDLAVRSWIRPAYSLEKARVKVASFRPLDMGAVGANSTVLQELDAFDLSPAMKAQMRAYAEERWDIFEAGLASLEQLPSRPETYPFFPPLPTYGLLSPVIETLDKSTFVPVIEDFPPDGTPTPEPRLGKELSEEDMATFCPPQETRNSLRRVINEKVYHYVDESFELVGEGVTDILSDPDGNSHWLFKDANNEVYDEQIFVGNTQYVNYGNGWTAVPNPWGPEPSRSANMPGYLCAFSVHRLADILDHGTEMLDGVLLRHVSAIDLTPSYGRDGQRIILDFWFDAQGRAVQFKVTDFVPGNDSDPAKPARRVETVTTFTRPEGPVVITAPEVAGDAK